MKMVLNIILIFTLFFVSCNQNEKTGNNKAFKNSKVDTNPKEFGDYFIEKNKVELKTDKNIYITRISDLIVRDSNYIIADRPGKQILVFDRSGNYRNMIGRSGTEPGEYINARSIDINSKNEVLVLDDRSGRISKFKVDGKFIKYYNIRKPATNILADQDDGFYLYNTVSELRPVDEDIIMHFNNYGENDFSFGKPFFQLGICFGKLVKDHNNNLYASQEFCYKIEKYSSDGKYLSGIDFMTNYINPLEWDDYNSYPPLKKMHEWSRLTNIAVNSKYILLEIRESVKEGRSMDIYDLEGNLLVSRIKIPMHLKFAAIDDNGLLYFVKDNGENLDLTKVNCQVITYKIKEL